MSKYIIIGIFITLVGISLDAIAVRSRGRRRNLLALFIMAVGCSVIVQIISQNMTTLYARILGGGLLLAGIILRFGYIKFTWLNLGDNESGSNSGGVSWIRYSSRGFVFVTIFSGILFLADIVNLIP